MALAVTHVLLVIVLVSLYRDYVTKHKRYFTIHTVFVAGLAGLLPDIDIPLNWLTSPLGLDIVHRGLTHTPFFALIFLIPAFILWKKRKHKKAMYFFVIAFGILMHVMLDFVFLSDIHAHGISLFFPFSDVKFGFPTFTETHAAAFDAVILLLWLYYEERKHKIRDYI